MRPLRCCVSGCGATSDTHRLFSFPKNDSLRKRWLSHLVPTTATLLGLSKEQLRSRRVCERHFDKHQFYGEGQRLRYSYPCLFTEDEIAVGEPLRPSGSVYDILYEHNYSKEEDDSDDMTEAVLVIGHPGEDFHEHPSCSQQITVTVVMGKGEPARTASNGMNQINQPSISQAGEYFHKHPSWSQQQTVTAVIGKDTAMKKFRSKKRKYMKHVTKLSTDSLGHTSVERLDLAQSCARNETLFSNFDLLSKPAQSFLMQLPQCCQNKMARRFTLEDKLTALALMKQSPKGDKLLENMFALPNKRTLHRLSEKITLEPGLNPQIFQHLNDKVGKWSTEQKLYPVQNTETTEQNLEDISLKHPVKNNEQSQESRALNAQALKITLARIQENPQLYIGIPKNCYHIVDLLHKHTKIPTTHILLCLKKVKLDTHFEELADQFGIPSKEAKGIFVKNIPVIAKTLQSFIANLNSKNIKSNLLIPFRRHQNTTTVIDTLELKVQPTTSQSKELTQSENGNTVKYLISCCPDGFVDYVSPGYGGRQTDENLLESTGYLERFDPGSCIITKRFKNAEPMLLRKGMKLLRPRSYTKQSSPRAGQYAPYKRVLNDHIERVVQRVREFTMIKDNTVISSDLVRVLDEAVVISCALVNLQSFVIN